MYKQYYLSSFLFIIFLFSLNSIQSSMITIPLKVIHNSFEKYPISKKINSSLDKKEKINKKLGSNINIFSEEYISGEIKQLKCLIFVTQIEIGNDQKFNVILDTGSVNLWVPKVGSQDKYIIKNHYDPSKSSYSTRTSVAFEINYGTILTKGIYYKDMINFFNITNYLKFGVASYTDFDVEGADGIMGLAKGYSSYEDSAIWTMYAKGQISSKSFSFKYFSDDNIQMYLGDEHEDFKNENNTGSCKLLSNTTYDNLVWTCKLYSFGLISNDNSTKSNTSCGYNIKFDTASNIIILSLETLEKIKDELVKYNCYSTETKLGYQIFCEDINNLPHIFIELGNYILFLNNDELYYRMYDERKDKFIYALNCYFMENVKYL